MKAVRAYLFSPNIVLNEWEAAMRSLLTSISYFGFMYLLHYCSLISARLLFFYVFIDIGIDIAHNKRVSKSRTAERSAIWS